MTLNTERGLDRITPLLPTARGKPIRILIADDHEVVRRGLCAWLELDGEEIGLDLGGGADGAGDDGLETVEIGGGGVFEGQRAIANEFVDVGVVDSELGAAVGPSRLPGRQHLGGIKLRAPASSGARPSAGR